jgi:hypothetical protein
MDEFPKRPAANGTMKLFAPEKNGVSASQKGFGPEKESLRQYGAGDFFKKQVHKKAGSLQGTKQVIGKYMNGAARILP